MNVDICKYQLLSSRNRLGAIFALLVFLVITVASFNIYLAKALNGDIDKHILSGEMFGTPSSLAAKGLSPLYYGEGETGWDGQFYYYMANDILATKDTPQHIDNPPYRYQRVGFSLLASLASKLMGNEWVSPLFYFVLYLGLVSCATYAGARLLQEFNAKPLLVLLWSLSVGTQITLFSALPDAAADAFLIIGLLALHRKHYFWGSFSLLFAGLSREVYIVFPAAIYIFAVYSTIAESGWSWRITSWLSALEKTKRHGYLLISIVGVMSWQFFVYYRFGKLGGSDASGILGLPLKAWWTYFISGVSGEHLLVGGGFSAYAEVFCLFMFLLILLGFMALALGAIRKMHDLSPLLGGIVITGLSLSLLYFCFGSTVIMHYTGYFKALSIFFFLLPLVMFTISCSKAIKRVFISVLVLAFFGSSLYQFKTRIVPERSIDKYTQVSKISTNEPIECFADYKYNVEIKSVEILKRDIFNLYPLMLLNVQLTNNGQYPLVSTRAGRGSVHLSYRWVDASGKTIWNGIRTAIPSPLMPGAVMDAYVVSPLPSKPGKLVVSPVQEGCAWFYMANPQPLNR